MAAPPAAAEAADSESVVVSDQIDPAYEPTPSEVTEYSEWLGMDLRSHRHLMWIAREALKAPLPEHWKLCQSPKGELFYFHFKTGASSWDHPSDPAFKALFGRYRDSSPQLECDGESAGLECELGQLLRRAKHLGLITAESMDHVLDNVAAATIMASEYVQWWGPRVEAADQKVVSDKLAAHFEVLRQDLEDEQSRAGGGLWGASGSTPATQALESAIARLTPHEREVMKGKHHAVVQAWSQSQPPPPCSTAFAKQSPAGSPCTSPERSSSKVSSSAVAAGACGGGESNSDYMNSLFKPVQDVFGQINVSIFGFGRSQRTLLPV